MWGGEVMQVNPYAARPAFRIGDAVEVHNGTEWECGTVVRVYRENDAEGRAMWFYDVEFEFGVVSWIAYLRQAS